MSDSRYYNEILIAQRIRQVRLAKGLTQKTFSDSLGIVQGYLSSLERGQKFPSHILLIALCHTYGVREEWLFGGIGPLFGENSRQSGGSTDTAPGKTPLLKNIPQDFPDIIEEEALAGHIDLPDVPEGCFAIVAAGDFMAPTIRDGDLVIFRPGSELANRSIILLNNKWGEVILRRVRVTGSELFFSAENTTYTPFNPDANTKIFGTVVGVWRNVKIF
jgi:SOS-response transcriptional repressor LexA